MQAKLERSKQYLFRYPRAQLASYKLAANIKLAPNNNIPVGLSSQNLHMPADLWTIKSSVV